MASKGAGQARKMAKKGGQASLQVEINNDEEWEALLERPGLIVVDIYSEWCGPCVAMMSNLKKIKLESGNDNFHLALANADCIAKLQRFRGRSEPTWMIIGGGQLLRVMFGSNAPLLMRTIVKELERETRCMKGELERLAFPFEEMTEEEKAKLLELEGKRMVEAEKEKKELAMAMDKVKRRNMERLSRVLNTYTVVVFFPNAIKEPEDPTQVGKRTCPVSYKLMAKYDTVGLSISDQMDIQLTREEVADMLYNSGITLPEEVLSLIEQRPVIGTLLQEMTPIMERSPSVTSEVSVVSVSSTMDVVEKKMATLAYGYSMDPMNPESDSIAKIYETVDPENGIKLPCLWTPLEHISKSSALQVLFPLKVANTNVKIDELPPPSAKRAHEVLDAAQPFHEDVLHVGFFDSVEPDKAQKVCTTVHELDKFGEGKITETKMVIALRKTTSDPMLILAQMNPLYISSDLASGTKEMEQFFPPSIEPGQEQDPWAPPPAVPKVFWTDDEENVWVEEEKITFEGDVVKGRRLVQLADGTEVEDGEWQAIPTEEKEVPLADDVDEEGEAEQEIEDPSALDLGSVSNFQDDDDNENENEEEGESTVE